MKTALNTAAALALFFAAAAPAQASEDRLALRIALHAGAAIAAQGNAALASIKEEIQDTIVEKMKPLLPQVLTGKSEAGATATDSAANKPQLQR